MAAAARGLPLHLRTEWVAVKLRWHLSVDTLERTALRRILAACPAHTVRVNVLPGGH